MGAQVKHRVKLRVKVRVPDDTLLRLLYTEPPAPRHVLPIPEMPVATWFRVAWTRNTTTGKSTLRLFGGRTTPPPPPERQKL